MIFPFKVGDVVTPADKKSTYYGRHGVVTRVGEDDCWVRYGKAGDEFCHFTWPLKLVEEHIIDKVMSKYGQ
jgi:hypothetical protein